MDTQQYDINIAQSIKFIVQGWRLIFVLSLLALALSALLYYIQPKSYQASASVLAIIEQNGAKIGTGNTLMSFETVDLQSRKQGIIALAKNSAIEERISQEILNKIEPTNYQPGKFTEENKISVRSEGDLIVISAQADTPEKAQMLANAWAETYVEYVNTLYTDNRSEVRLAGRALRPLTPLGPGLPIYIVTGILGGLFISIAILLFKFILYPSATQGETTGH